MQNEIEVDYNGQTFEVKFPNNREYVRIQNLKSILASNYESLQYIGTEGSFAEMIVDAEAHLTVMCPKLVKSLNVPIGDLSLVDMKTLTALYAEKIRPWYNECLNFIFGVDKKKISLETTETTTIVE